MQNVRKGEQKKCIFKVIDDFEYDVQQAFGEILLFTYTYEGFSCYYGDRDEEEVDNEVLCGKLSDYYDVEVTSVHMDDCDLIGMWIVYKELDNKHKLEAIAETLDEIQESEEFQSDELLMNEIGEAIGYVDNVIDMLNGNKVSHREITEEQIFRKVKHEYDKLDVEMIINEDYLSELNEEEIEEFFKMFDLDNVVTVYQHKSDANYGVWDNIRATLSNYENNINSIIESVKK